MLGVIRIFTVLAPLFIGANAVGALIRCKHQDQYRATCRSSKFLIVSIILLLIIPGEFLYSTFHSSAPSGSYTVEVDYIVEGAYEDNKGKYQEYYKSGRAPLVVYFDHDTEYEEYNDRTSVREYSAYYARSIKLSCFNNKSFDLDDSEISSFHEYEYEIQNNSHVYDLTIRVGDLEKDHPGSTWEEKLQNVSILALVEHLVLFLLSVLGIVGYIISRNTTEYCKPKHYAATTPNQKPNNSERDQATINAVTEQQRVERQGKVQENAASPKSTNASVEEYSMKSEEVPLFSHLQKAAQDIDNSKKEYSNWYH